MLSRCRICASKQKQQRINLSRSCRRVAREVQVYGIRPLGFFVFLASVSASEIIEEFVCSVGRRRSEETKGAELAIRSRKLSALKLVLLPLPPTYSAIVTRRNYLNPKPISLPPCPEEPTSYGGIQYLHLSNHPNPEVSCFSQKGFSEITRDINGRALHGLCVKGFVPVGVFGFNTLVNMYSKFGRIGYARSVFDNIPERNEASWNTMISGYVRVGLYSESIGFFCEMIGCGVKPSGFVIASLITACDKSACRFSEGLQVHGFVVKVGLFCDVFVGTSLLHFYGTYGFVSSAQKIFEKMPEKNVVTWTSLIVGHSNNGDSEEVINIYKRMIYEGVCCNDNTFAIVISTCGMLGNELLGHQVLGHVVKLGLETSVSVANSLISMYGSCGNVDEACYVFDQMDERDIISWNSIISANAQNGLCEESLRHFQCMRSVNKEENSTTLSTLLTVCGSSEKLKWGSGIHGLVVKLGLESNVCVGNTLLNMYSAAGRSEDAELVFQRMIEKDIISWNSMLACYVQNDEYQNALELFSEMLRMRKPVNYVTLTSALSACPNPEFLIEGKILHALAVFAGIQDNLIIGNALVTMYGKFGMMVEAEKVLQIMPNRDQVTWNTLIGGYAESKEPNEAIKAFKFMREEGTPANYITIINVLGAFLTPGDLLKHGMPIHAHIVLTGFDLDKHVQSSLITMYAKCGDLNSSNSIFNGLAFKNSIAWNALISANANHGLEEALKLVVMMRKAGVDLDQFSLSVALSVSADLAMLEEGQQLHALVVKLGFDSDDYVTNAAMDMYGKCGNMEDVLKLLPLPTSRSRLSWNILISSYAKHGCFPNAREAFHEMLNIGMNPDHVTFVSLLSACSHGGLVDDGLAYYNAMTTEFGVPPGIEHCVCMIDLLGRSGRLAEAENFIKGMVVPPNDLVWRSLLAACKIHRNVELARKAAEHLLELDPSDDSAYVLFSNVCATTARWEEVEDVRRQMGSRNITKKPACSWVKLKTEVSKFGMGDQSHPQTEQIYAKLGELMKMIREAGYVPDTSDALQDTDEEQKEQNLWNHSERIALAFALLNTPEGSPVKVFKNLRVCGDCHSVYKHVSAVVGQKIILRDPYRFHHFSDGECSCSDYW